VVEVQGDRARLWAPWIEVVAAPVTADAVAGATISLRGHIAPDGTVAVDAMTVHERHGIKKAIGIGITMVVVVLVGWDLRAGRRRRA
jgi:hypothetical protein